ncbi:MAG: hypothetical protein KME16_09180 [Scytolyngbya sp. HA4215-MV1]|nr:hypothetical protein [Scytolyngbya sp. HA4215-MV1]
MPISPLRAQSKLMQNTRAIENQRIHGHPRVSVFLFPRVYRIVRHLVYLP